MEPRPHTYNHGIHNHQKIVTKIVTISIDKWKSGHVQIEVRLYYECKYVSTLTVVATGGEG